MDLDIYQDPVSSYYFPAPPGVLVRRRIGWELLLPADSKLAYGLQGLREFHSGPGYEARAYAVPDELVSEVQKKLGPPNAVSNILNHLIETERPQGTLKQMVREVAEQPDLYRGRAEYRSDSDLLPRLQQLPTATFDRLVRSRFSSDLGLSRWELELLLTNHLQTVGRGEEIIQTVEREQAQQEADQERDRRVLRLARWERQMPSLVGTTVIFPVGNRNRQLGYEGQADFTIGSFRRDRQGRVERLTLQYPRLRDVELQRDPQRPLHYYVAGETGSVLDLEPLFQKWEAVTRPIVHASLVPLVSPDLLRYIMRAV